MGYGDEIMATGLARGAAARGKRIAFGDGKNIVFSPWSAEMFRNNPNIAFPGTEDRSDVEWIAHHKGNRLYNSLDKTRTKWVWNMDFKPVPGEFFFSDEELEFAESAGKDFIVVEPNLPRAKSVAPNKDWGAKNYMNLIRELSASYEVVQFKYPGALTLSPRARFVRPPSFRFALAALQRAKLYIGPEGGMHHGAAAVGVRGVVIFGGFIPPSVTGYDMHINLTGNAQQACGSLRRCRHCMKALESITVGEVLDHANNLMKVA